jgi:hypothetical protein
MDRTLLLSRRSSSSCSRIDGVIRERTISVRFSRLMNKKTPAESTRRGRRCPQTGGEAAGWCSFEKPHVPGPGYIVIDRMPASVQRLGDFWSGVPGLEHFHGLEHQLLGGEHLSQAGNSGSLIEPASSQRRFSKGNDFNVFLAERSRGVFAPNNDLMFTKTKSVQDWRNQFRVFREGDFPFDSFPHRGHAVVPPLLKKWMASDVLKLFPASNTLQILPRASIGVLAMTLELEAFSSLALNGHACMPVAVISGDTDFLEELTDPLSGNAFLLPQVLEGHVLRRVLLGEAINALIVHVGLRWVDVGAQPVTAYDPVSGLLYSQNTARRATSPSPYSLCLDPYSSSKGCGASGNLDRVF